MSKRDGAERCMSEFLKDNKIQWQHVNEREKKHVLVILVYRNFEMQYFCKADNTNIIFLGCHKIPLFDSNASIYSIFFLLLLRLFA